MFRHDTHWESPSCFGAHMCACPGSHPVYSLYTSDLSDIVLTGKKAHPLVSALTHTRLLSSWESLGLQTTGSKATMRAPVITSRSECTVSHCQASSLIMGYPFSPKYLNSNSLWVCVLRIWVNFFLLSDISCWRIRRINMIIISILPKAIYRIPNVQNLQSSNGILQWNWNKTRENPKFPKWSSKKNDGILLFDFNPTTNLYIKIKNRCID